MPTTRRRSCRVLLRPGGQHAIGRLSIQHERRRKRIALHQRRTGGPGHDVAQIDRLASRADEPGVRPVGLVVGDAVACIQHDQFQIPGTRDVRFDRARGLPSPAGGSADDLPAVHADDELHRALPAGRVAIVVHAHVALEAKE